jgi:adenylyltransferase/sulfurtransferase
VYGAGIREQGSVFSVVPGGPCLRCVYPNATTDETCAMSGVLNTITHIIASMQVTEGLKILLGKEPCPDLLRYDVWKQEFSRIKVSKNKDCDVC